jgi:hypothetical protein
MAFNGKIPVHRHIIEHKRNLVKVGGMQNFS